MLDLVAAVVGDVSSGSVYALGKALDRIRALGGDQEISHPAEIAADRPGTRCAWASFHLRLKTKDGTMKM
jgi:hypothetical protein